MKGRAQYRDVLNVNTEKINMVHVKVRKRDRKPLEQRFLRIPGDNRLIPEHMQNIHQEILQRELQEQRNVVRQLMEAIDDIDARNNELD